MIIKGGARCASNFYAAHLMRTDTNERVSVEEIRGLAARDVREAFREMDAIASGSRAKNGFYVASLNPSEGETLTAGQWEKAVDRLEHELGLDGQPRFRVQHEKNGRTHEHVVWSRIDADTMGVIPADFNYQKHERAARAIEEEFGLAPVESVLVKDRETERPERRPKDWEGFRAADSGIDPQAMKAELTALWAEADSGLAFKSALEQVGYILAKGDRRDFVVIDQAGDSHSLARRLSGVKAAEIRERMADVDRTKLPSVAEARELATTSDAGTSDPLPAEDAPHAEQPGQRRPEGEPELAGSSFPDNAILLPAMREEGGGTPRRVSPWGAAWRVFADRAAHYADRLYALLQDEGSGTPGDLHIPHAKQPGWLSRALDAALRPHHPDGHGLADGSPLPEGEGGDMARPGGNVQPPEPDTAAPQTEQDAPVEPQSAFQALVEAWLHETWDATPEPEAFDPPDAESEAPDYDGPDID